MKCERCGYEAAYLQSKIDLVSANPDAITGDEFEKQRHEAAKAEGNGWVKIGQRGDLPPQDTPETRSVLLQWERDGEVRFSIAEFAFGLWHTPGEGCINPIAWMPLPKPYESTGE